MPLKIILRILYNMYTLTVLLEKLEKIGIFRRYILSMLNTNYYYFYQKNKC